MALLLLCIVCAVSGMIFAERNVFTDPLEPHAPEQQERHQKEEFVRREEQPQTKKQDGRLTELQLSDREHLELRTGPPPWPLDVQHPVISLSLPNTGSALLPNYFKCAASREEERPYNYTTQFGRHWIQQPSQHAQEVGGGGGGQHPRRMSIGKCLYQNMQRNATNNNIWQGCGDDSYTVWHDLTYIEPPSLYGLANNHSYWMERGPVGFCWDPVVTPGALLALHKARPNATVITQIPADVDTWYSSLSLDQFQIWSTWCNHPVNHHPNSNSNRAPLRFPIKQTREAYRQFVMDYHQRLRTFVREQAPGWRLLELDLSLPAPKLAPLLSSYLGIGSSQCWMDAVVPHETNDPSLESATSIHNQKQQPPSAPRQPTTTNATVIIHNHQSNEIHFPIFVASLPKSGTSTTADYFGCNLGSPQFSIHQWYRQEVAPFASYTIAECQMNNMAHDRPLFEGCGHGRVFSDLGVFRQAKWWKQDDNDKVQDLCFYPQLHGGLEAFAKAYPHATILLVVRDAMQWAKSAQRHGQNLLKKWDTVCGKDPTKGFPPPKSDLQVWAAWYDNVTLAIRNFALQQHPSLHYIEVPLSDTTGDVLDDIFGFQKGCWGHANANPKKT